MATTAVMEEELVQKLVQTTLAAREEHDAKVRVKQEQALLEELVVGSIENINTTVDNISKRIAQLEEKQKNRHQRIKKTLGAECCNVDTYLSVIVTIVVVGTVMTLFGMLIHYDIANKHAQHNNKVMLDELHGLGTLLLGRLHVTNNTTTIDLSPKQLLNVYRDSLTLIGCLGMSIIVGLAFCPLVILRHLVATPFHPEYRVIIEKPNEDIDFATYWQDWRESALLIGHLWKFYTLLLVMVAVLVSGVTSVLKADPLVLAVTVIVVTMYLGYTAIFTCCSASYGYIRALTLMSNEAGLDMVKQDYEKTKMRFTSMALMHHILQQQ